MPKLIDMARKQKKGKNRLASVGGDGKYPYGLSLSLEVQELKKLGVSAKDLQGGEKVQLTAVAVIERVSVPVEEQPYAESGVSLKITHLAMERDGDKEFSTGFKQAARKHGKQAAAK